MYIELEKNAFDSLQYGLQYYKRFLRLQNKYDDRNPTYLKMALIMIHNAVELYSKKALSNVNELLIYKDLSDENLLEKYSYKVNKNDSLSLDYYIVVGDISVFTVEYVVLIKRLKFICDLDEVQYANLDWLGKFRNKVNHFGIDVLTDYYRILIVINSALNILINDIYDKLKPNRDGEKSLDCLKESIQALIKKGKAEEKESWQTYFSESFTGLNRIISQIKLDEEFKKYLSKQKFKLKVKQGKYEDSAHFTFNFMHFDKHQSFNIIAVNNPFLNVTFFVGDSQDMFLYFILDHHEYFFNHGETKCFYIYKRIESKPSVKEITTKFWELDKQNRLCYVTEFSYDNLIRGLKEVLGHAVHGVL